MQIGVLNKKGRFRVIDYSRANFVVSTHIFITFKVDSIFQNVLRISFWIKMEQTHLGSAGKCNRVEFC